MGVLDVLVKEQGGWYCHYCAIPGSVMDQTSSKREGLLKFSRGEGGKVKKHWIIPRKAGFKEGTTGKEGLPCSKIGEWVSFGRAAYYTWIKAWTPVGQIKVWSCLTDKAPTDGSLSFASDNLTSHQGLLLLAQMHRETKLKIQTDWCEIEVESGSKWLRVLGWKQRDAITGMRGAIGGLRRPSRPRHVCSCGGENSLVPQLPYTTAL